MAFDETGYTPEPLQSILDTIAADAIAVNPNLDPSVNSLMGILTGLFSIQLEQQYQHIAELFSSLDPDTAEGKALDVIAWRQGLIRKEGETDAQLRFRVKRFLSAGGNSTVQAMYAQVSNISGITDVNIAENDCHVQEERQSSDVNAPVTYRPPNSFEVCVEGGDDNEIARVIRLTKPAGIQAFGETVIPSVDAQGVTRAIGFTRAQSVDIFLRLSYSLYNEELFPANGEDQIADALVAFGAQEYVLGKDIIAQRIVGQVHEAVRGIQNVTVETSLDGVNFITSSRPMAAYEKANILKANIIFNS
ncbi:MAG: hypothetical protein HRU26_08905 [Psychroserpens sp.]|nr:hypothetical protein [Psychroserpens sp.]